VQKEGGVVKKANTHTVMLVEDNSDQVELFSLAMKMAIKSLKVITVKDGEEAIEKLGIAPA
jgi:CheY-like chemotaxis protein